jgi:hypothetical protein
MMQSIEDSYDIDIGRSDLANARSYPSSPVDEEAGLWDSNVASTTNIRRRRIKQMILVVGFLLFIVIIAIAIAGRAKNNDGGNTNDAAAVNNPRDLFNTTLPPNTSEITPTVPNGAATTPTKPSDEAVPKPTSVTSPAVTSATDSPPDVTVPPTSVPETSHVCKGNRIDSNDTLEENQYICSSNKMFRFGMNKDGSLVYYSKEQNATASIYNGTKGNYFELLNDATWTVQNNSTVVWEAPCALNVSFTKECVREHKDTYDCPSLHLHDGGWLNLNYVEGEEFKGENVLHIYDDIKGCSHGGQFVCK